MLDARSLLTMVLTVSAAAGKLGNIHPTTSASFSPPLKYTVAAPAFTLKLTTIDHRLQPSRKAISVGHPNQFAGVNLRPQRFPSSAQQHPPRIFPQNTQTPQFPRRPEQQPQSPAFPKVQQQTPINKFTSGHLQGESLAQHHQGQQLRFEEPRPQVYEPQYSSLAQHQMRQQFPSSVIPQQTIYHQSPQVQLQQFPENQNYYPTSNDQYLQVSSQYQPTVHQQIQQYSQDMNSFYHMPQQLGPKQHLQQQVSTAQTMYQTYGAAPTSGPLLLPSARLTKSAYYKRPHVPAHYHSHKPMPPEMQKELEDFLPEVKKEDAFFPPGENSPGPIYSALVPLLLMGITLPALGLMYTYMNRRRRRRDAASEDDLHHYLDTLQRAIACFQAPQHCYAERSRMRR